mmetsp:Transcript_13043/g.41691  ORF Transcript_13043/g.41691 Transcript_13043/m.41691 type:complete len:288 (-) Transcript_13043:246-1109(-)
MGSRALHVQHLRAHRDHRGLRWHSRAAGRRDHHRREPAHVPQPRAGPGDAGGVPRGRARRAVHRRRRDGQGVPRRRGEDGREVCAGARVRPDVLLRRRGLQGRAGPPPLPRPRGLASQGPRHPHRARGARGGRGQRAGRQALRGPRGGRRPEARAHSLWHRGVRGGDQGGRCEARQGLPAEPREARGADRLEVQHLGEAGPEPRASRGGWPAGGQGRRQLGELRAGGRRRPRARDRQVRRAARVCSGVGQGLALHRGPGPRLRRLRQAHHAAAPQARAAARGSAHAL